MPSTGDRPPVKLVDVNVFVYAHRPEMVDHERYRSWLFTEIGWSRAVRGL